MRVLSDNTKFWDRLYDEYGFRPQYTKESYKWINPPAPFKVFALPENCWNEEQEKLVNSFFIKLDLNELYALDWQHDCFSYDPKEEIHLGYEYRDEDRQCNVYFPDYYPNGDYYFFVDPDLKFGLYGHPWLQEIVVVGEELIKLFEDNAQSLGIMLKEKSEG